MGGAQAMHRPEPLPDMRVKKWTVNSEEDRGQEPNGVGLIVRSCFEVE